MEEHKDDISPLVARWLPAASREEQIEATQNLRAYLVVLCRIARRLDSDEKGKLPGGRDKNCLPARVYTDKNKNV